MLEHHADAAAQRAQLMRLHAPPRAVRLDIADQPALDADLARIIGFEEVDAAEQRALARSARPDQADHLGALHVEVDVAQNRQRAEALAEAADRDHRAGSAVRKAVTRASARRPAQATSSTSSQ